MAPSLIGVRIKALREERKLSQDDLARVFGFKDRQTVSAIETGERRVTAEELVAAVQALGAPLDYFTDPFRLVGEGRFSWRQTGVTAARLDGFAHTAGRWIAAYRTLAPAVGRPAPYLRQSLMLTSRSGLADAMAAGEHFAADFTLGDVPAARLVDAMERRLGILVLMVDTIDGVASAACRLPNLDAIMINRHQVAGPRHFEIAHQLFHVLTWDAMPPAHVEDTAEQSRGRVEQLADGFASAVLIPAAALDRFGPPRGDLVEWLNDTAEALQVPATALKWRLVALDRLTPAQAKSISEPALLNNGRDVAGRTPPARFSQPFMEVLAPAIARGHISARKAADILDMTIEDIGDLCEKHGVPATIDL